MNDELTNIPSASANVEWIIGNLDNSDVATRQKAAAGAQYALLGALPEGVAPRLLEKVADRLRAKVNGHVMLNEPCEYVRQRCANAIEMAASKGKDVSAYMTVLAWSKDNDPHEWVRDMAHDALTYISQRRDHLPLPKAWSTRPNTPGQSVRDLVTKTETQLRA